MIPRLRQYQKNKWYHLLKKTGFYVKVQPPILIYSPTIIFVLVRLSDYHRFTNIDILSLPIIKSSDIVTILTFLQKVFFIVFHSKQPVSFSSSSVVRDHKANMVPFLRINFKNPKVSTLPSEGKPLHLTSSVKSLAQGLYREYLTP